MTPQERRHQGAGIGCNRVGAAEGRIRGPVTGVHAGLQQVIAQLGNCKGTGEHQRAEFEKLATAEVANFFFAEEVNRRSCSKDCSSRPIWS